MTQLADRTVTTPLGDAPVIPVLVMAAGAYLCWFGVRYWRSDTQWPTDPIKAVLTGKPLPVPDRSASDRALAAIGGAAGASGAGAGAGAAGGAAAGAAAPGLDVTSKVLSNSQLQQLWVANGGSVGTAPLAAAIAEAESSGNVTGPPSANPDGGTNVGLWQLDTRGVGAGYTVTQLEDPNMNARITVMATVNGTNWNQWETWHTGAYRKYLQPAAALGA